MLDYKLIYFDLDGTLLPHDCKLLDGTKKAISTLKEAGLRISLATGRNQKSCLQYIEELDIQEVVVTENGVMLYSPNNQETEISHLIPPAAVHELIQFEKQHPLAYRLCITNNDILQSPTGTWPKEYLVSGKNQIVTTMPETGIQVAKVVFLDTEENHKNMALFFEYIQNHSELAAKVRFFKSHPNYKEMIDHRVSKGASIQLLAERLGIDLKQVIAVGDHGNDYEMIERAGLGVAVQSDCEDIQKVCQMVIPPPEKGGIEQLCQQLLK